MKLILSVTLFSLLSSFSSGEDQDQNENKRYIVKGPSAEAAAEGLGGVIKRRTRRFTAIEFPTTDKVNAFRNQATKNGFQFEEDQIRQMIPGMSDVDGTNPLAESIPWGIKRTYERNGVVDIPEDGYFPDSANHPICVIDSGYDVDHPDLPNDAEGTKNGWSNDQCDHGTHVSGTIAAIGGNNEGVVGVWPGAPDVKVARVFKTIFGLCLFSYASDLIGAAEDCQDLGAKITTMSLGGTGSSTFEREAFQDLYDEGMLHIAAAGNSANSDCSYPACYDSIMSVGATDIGNNIAAFSQYNSQTEISAPGVNVRSTIPNNKYDNYDGTSMATPHVSGAALVLWNKIPSATNDQVREALNEGAIDLGTPGRDNYYGNGLLNYWRSYDILRGNVPDECVDSLLTGAGGSPTCTDISDTSVCVEPGYNSHCPKACIACEDFRCVDSTLRWQFNDKEYDCLQLASAPEKRRNKACALEEISSTCRATCGCV